MTNKKILIVSQYFHPETFRVNDIAKEWVDQGNEVTVLTGIPNYPRGRFYKGYSWFKKRKENYLGINIIRLPIIARRNNKFSLVLNYLSFVLSGFVWKTITKKVFDFIFVYEVSPMTQALPGIWYAKKMKIPVFVYITDLWPDNVISVTGLKNRWLINRIDNMVMYIYKNSTGILTSSNSFKWEIEARGIEPDKVFFWPQYAEDIYADKRNSYNDEFKILFKDPTQFNIIFTGNIGTAQGLDILVDVAKRISKSKLNIRFILVGDGRYKNELLDLVNKEKLSHYFLFIDQQPIEKIPSLLQLSDSALLVLNENEIYSKTIPSKLQSYLASGIPVIASVDGESQDIIKTSKAGLYSNAGDSNGLYKNIIQMYETSKQELNDYRINARLYYEKNYNKTQLFNQFDEWVGPHI